MPANSATAYRLPWYRSILTKQILIFFLLIIPLYATCYSFYRTGASSIQDEVEQTLASQDQLFLNTLQNQVEAIQGIQNSFFNDDDLVMLEGSSGFYTVYERSQMILQIQQKLVLMRNSNRLIERVNLYVPALDLKITDSRAYAPAAGEVAGLTAVDARGEAHNLKYHDLALHSIIAHNPAGAGAPKFIFDVTLSGWELEHLLDGLYAEPGNAAAILCGDDLIYRGNPLLRQPLQGMADASSPAKGRVSLEDGAVYLYQIIASPQMGIRLVHFQSYSQNLLALDTYRREFTLLAIVSLVVAALFILYIHTYLKKPLGLIVTAFQRFQSGDLESRIVYTRKDEFRLLVDHFNTMCGEWEQLLEREYRQKMLLQRSELKQLQSQIDPHFLYNSFFILSRRVKRGDIQGAELFGNQLGEYFRFITKNTSDTVPLRSEIEHVRNYAAIQATRYRGRVEVIFPELPAEMEAIPVPRLILQPIIENAFEHGLAEKETGGIIRVSYRLEPGAAHITVEDNGDSLTDETLAALERSIDSGQGLDDSTAIDNVSRRLRIAFGNMGKPTVFRSALGGLGVRMTLPLGDGTDGGKDANDA